MKLSGLVEHTGKWLSIPSVAVGTYARFLRQSRKISGGVKGGGAAEMTTDDKISLLVAVLGCGTARTCAQALPRLLALPATKGDLHLTTNKLTFFNQADLKHGLLALFDDIRDGKVDAWRDDSERVFAKGGGGKGLSVQVIVTFEVDGEHVKIHLSVTGPTHIGKAPASLIMQFEQEYGRRPTTDLAGFSRRIHEISLERLTGWGGCLTKIHGI
jgi:hypothetical protein